MENHQPATEPVDGPVTDAERAYAVDLLQTTREALRVALLGLSAAQQRYKPAPDRWSVLECAEHIMLVEKGIFRSIQSGMTLPADPARRADVKVSDLFVIKAVRSRNTTTVAPAPFEPTGRYADVQAAFSAFDQVRTTAIDYAQNTPDDLRTHYFEHFVLGTLDDHQALLLLASHGERHRKQIDEVKADAGFPA